MRSFSHHESKMVKSTGDDANPRANTDHQEIQFFTEQNQSRVYMTESVAFMDPPNHSRIDESKPSLEPIEEIKHSRIDEIEEEIKLEILNS